ncbi:Protein Iojap-related, mitochondrial [Apostasia shenzhenica]|uniref:Protein Iojap-related, mitochondrial n=1 Tax=Apostasia shenzhenica TaxID=1088818 RepID=A0A2I0B2R2_9ASPA|nr:Protein Iojap-related, mitochondrial [Apostasia shenzhenica]
MLRAIWCRTSAALIPRIQHPVPWTPLGFCSAASSTEKRGFLDLEEVQKVLADVKADDVKVMQVRDQCDWTDYMVFATGRSTWHVRNIAQALLHKAGLSHPFVKSGFLAGSRDLWSDEELEPFIVFRLILQSVVLGLDKLL